MADTLLTTYQRVPPPSDPSSAQGHLDGELTKLERTTRETIAKLNTLSTTYAPLTGVGATGTWPISITGNAVGLANGTNQSVLPYGVLGYTLASPTGQGSVQLQLTYGGSSVGGYLYVDSGGISFLSASAASSMYVDNSGNATFAGGVTANFSFVMQADKNAVFGLGRHSSSYGGAAIDLRGGATFWGIQFAGVDKHRFFSNGDFSVPGALTAGSVTGYAPLSSPALTGAPTAPTQASGDNSTKLATTAYADAASPWKLLKKTTDQTISATTAFADDTTLQFPVAANKTYAFRCTYFVSITSGTGGHKIAVNGPAGFTRLRAQTTPTGGVVAITAYDTVIDSTGSGVASFMIQIEGSITTGATAGTFAMRLSQNAASGVTLFEAGSTLEYLVVV